MLVNLSMLQSGIGVPNIDDAYWTLFVELKFYILFAIVVMRGVTYRSCVLFCAAWTLAGVVAPTADNGVLSFFAVSTSSPYFIAGIALYLMRRFRPNAVLWAVVGVQFLLAQHHVHARMISSLGRAATDRTPAWPAHLVIGVTAAMLLLAWLIHRLVERPLGRRLRDRLRSGLQDIRSATPRGPSIDRLPAQPSAPDAERVPAGR